MDDDTDHWKVCSVCGYYNEEQKAELGTHDYNSGEDGKCKCGKNNPAHVHDWDDPVDAVEPSCTEAGNPYYVHCRTCDNYYSSTDGTELLSEGKAPVTEAKGHDTDGSALEDVGDGQNHGKKCNTCDEYVETAAHAMPTTPTKVDVSQHKLVCTECQYEKVESHNFGTESNRTNCACGEAYCVVENSDSISLSVTNLNLPNSGYGSNTDGLDIGGVTFKYEKLAKNGNNIQTNSNQTPIPYIWNSTAFAGDIRKITVVLGGSYTGNLLKLEFSTDGINYSTTDILYIAADNLSVDAPAGYKYIRITYGASSGMRLFASITIDYAISTENHVWQEQSRTGGSCLDGTPDNVTYKCARCGAEKTEQEAAKHTITLVDAQTATCTQQGWVAHYECSVCNKWFNDENGSQVIETVIQDKLEHQLEWRNGDGQHWQVCVLGNEDCDYVLQKQDHDETYGSNDNEHWLKCDTCGWVSDDKQGHDYTGDDDKCVCGVINPDKHTHSYVKNMWEGNDEQHWRVCDEGDYADMSTAVAHDNWEYTTNDDDQHDAHCKTCDKHVVQDHTQVKEPDKDHDPDYHWILCQYCDWDGELEDHKVASYPSHDADGHQAYCEICGDTFAQDHKFGDGGECVCGEKEAKKTPVDYTLMFGKDYNSKGTSAYSGVSFDATCNGVKWTIDNFNNNNNGWSYVKAGGKNSSGTATIKTAAAFSASINKVVMTIDAVTSSYITSITLEVANDANFSDVVKTVSPDKIVKGDSTFDLGAEYANCYFRINIAYNNTSGTNGIIQISKVVYSGFAN